MSYHLPMMIPTAIAPKYRIDKVDAFATRVVLVAIRAIAIRFLSIQGFVLKCPTGKQKILVIAVSYSDDLIEVGNESSE